MIPGEAATAEVGTGESLDLGEVIIPEVAFETKELVIAIEVDVIRPAAS